MRPGGLLLITPLPGDRWISFQDLAEISDRPGVDPSRAGVPAGGMIMVRPDGHIGFRHPSTGTAAFDALDDHLASYLVPDQNTAASTQPVPSTRD